MFHSSAFTHITRCLVTVELFLVVLLGGTAVAPQEVGARSDDFTNHVQRAAYSDDFTNGPHCLPTTVL